MKMMTVRVVEMPLHRIACRLDVSLTLSQTLPLGSGWNFHANSPLIIHMRFLLSFDQDVRVEKTLIQTLACQLSSTFIQLLFSFDQDMRVEKTFIQTLACQLSPTLIQLLFSFDQDMIVEKTLIQTLACQLLSTLMQLLFSFVINPNSNSTKESGQLIKCSIFQQLVKVQRRPSDSNSLIKTWSCFKWIIFYTVIS